MIRQSKPKSVISALALMLAVVAVQPATAAELSQFTASKVQKAIQLQQNEEMAKAVTLLEGIDTSRAYDKAYVSRMLGVFYWQQGHSDKAVTEMKKAVDSGLLEGDQAWTTQRMLADLLLTDQNYKQALAYYYPLTKSQPDDTKNGIERNMPELWLRIAQSHYQRQQWQQVLAAIGSYDAAKKTESVKGGKPVKAEEGITPLTLKLGAQIQLKKWQGSVSSLKALIALEPDNKTWWQQLTGSYQRLNQRSNILHTLVLAERQGIELSPLEYRMMAQIYAAKGAPERAARIIQQLPKTERTATVLAAEAAYWQQAREWQQAIDSWKLAAKADNQYRWSLAQLQLQQERYQDALASLDSVTDSSRKSAVELARVRAWYKLANYEKALLHAKRANEIDPSPQSESWLEYLSRRRDLKG